MVPLTLAIALLGHLCHVIAIAIPGVGIQATTAVQPVVDLGYSQYVGTALSTGVNQFLGMRYAAPPLGNLRFRAPTKPLNTTGIQQATAYAPICLGINVQLPSSTQSEDCLFIDVYAPANATNTSKLPVWVFIQGGGYTTNANANQNGAAAVANSNQSIVFVELNYRVGPYGFLASEKVRANGDLNAGLLDQRQALLWVKKYISKFGGNPDSVVIHGESAGAGSVATHLIAYGGRDQGLFQGAVLGSVFFPTQPKVSELEWQFDRFVNGTGCSGSTDPLYCLRTTNSTILQQSNVASAYPGLSTAPKFYWTPTIDGNLLRDYPYRLFEQGKFIKIPLLVGNDNNEGSAFAPNAATPAAISAFFQANYPHLSTNDTDAINLQYPLMPLLPAHAAYFPSASAAYGESTFTCPGNFISEAYARNSSRVWNYHYNLTTVESVASGLGTTHTFDLPAILGHATGSYATYNAAMVPILNSYYISFVKSLNPNTFKAPGAHIFEPFGSTQKRLLLQINGTTTETVPTAQRQRCTFWKSLAITMEQ